MTYSNSGSFPWTAGKRGTAANLETSGAISSDGFNNNDFNNSGSVLNILNGSSSATFATWFKLVNTPTSTVALMTAGDSEGAFLLISPSVGPMFQVISGPAQPECDFNSYNLSSNIWYHLVAVYDGTQGPGFRVAMYLNGVAQTLTCNAGVIPSTFVGTPAFANTFHLGVSSLYQRLSGHLDESRVYSRALASAEVLALYGQTGIAKSKNPDNNGLVGYWSMEDATGTTATDFSGNGNPGTLTNFALTGLTSNWVPGKSGKALVFDGTNDYVSGSGVTISNSAFTISAWIKSATYSADNQFFSLGSVGANDQSIHLRFTSATGFRFGMYNDDLNATFNAYANRWTLVTVTLDSSKLQTIYQDGVAKSSRTASSLFTGNTSWSIGRWVAQNSEFFNGSIDDVRIYNRALSAAEVTALYGKTGITHMSKSLNTIGSDALVGWWTFDGSKLTTTTARDSTTNANNGTLNGPLGANNAPQPVPGKVGQAFNFDGTDDWISAGSTGANLSEGSVALWVYKTTTSGTRSAIDLRIDGSNETAIDTYTVSSLRVSYSAGGTQKQFTLTEVSALNTWYHVVATWSKSADQVKVYVNGVQSGSTQTGLGTISGSTITNYIGNDPWGNYWQGNLDDVRVYNRALSASEALQLYNQGK